MFHTFEGKGPLIARTMSRSARLEAEDAGFFLWSAAACCRSIRRELARGHLGAPSKLD
jgi:hypothetical protein